MKTDSALAGILIQETNQLGYITLCQSAGNLSTTASKFAVGCLLTDTTTGKTYYNAGTVASPSWNSVADATVGEIALTTGSVLIGAAGVGSALDVKGNGKILVGNGTTATSVTVSGDVTLANTGAVTIGNNAVTTVKIADGNVTAAKIADTAGTSGLAIRKSALVVYDFAVDGGAQGTIALTGAPTIPDKACVWVESYEVLTTCTSGGGDAATITLQLPTDGPLLTAAAISDGANPWDKGLKISETGPGALPKKTTAARVPSLLVGGGQNLTAGKIIFQLAYWVSA
jgi:hypothetical protein